MADDQQNGPHPGPEFSIGVCTTLDIAIETLDRQFGCGGPAAIIAMAQQLAWQVTSIAPVAAGPFFTATIEMERARIAKLAGAKGADRRYAKAAKAMVAAADALWIEGEARQARAEGRMN